jgi:hypothetical protein
MDFLLDIRDEDNELYKYICAAIEEASTELDNVQNIFSEYTDHSTAHAKIVLKNGENLNREELNIYEKAIFVLSSYFHDVGMNVPQDRIEKYISELDDNINFDYYMSQVTISQELCDANIDIYDKKYFIALNFFRENHSIFSADYISKMYPITDRNSFVNGKYLWDSVSKICRAHTFDISEIKSSSVYMDDYYIEDGIDINILYLTILLRISDICHFSRDRAYPYILKDKFFKSRKSEKIWEYYSSVVTTVADKNTNTIKVQANCENFFQHRAIANDVKCIQNELIESHKLLIMGKSKYQLPWKYVDDTLVKQSPNANYHFLDLKFNLNNNKIIDLLMGEKLYGSPLYAIRECIQNSVDAVKIISSKIKTNHYIYLYYYETAEYPILEIFDSGTGMNLEIISNHFISVGTNSYWYSENGIKEWDINKSNLCLIADHGIGVLSYFMIAKQVEVYTKYFKDPEFIHIIIDDYKNNILCNYVPVKEFPLLKTSLDIKSPWDQMHGTCIKFILKKKIDFDVLLEFLAVNILRCPVNLYLNYMNSEYLLDDIWHFREEYDDYIYPQDYLSVLFRSKKPIDKTNLYDALYTYSKDFYHSQPQDKSLEDNEIDTDFFYGKMHLNYSNLSNAPCRISQNGILVKNAVDFISLNTYSGLVMKAYGFDIDIRNRSLFQLNAERTSIINNEYNQLIFEKIEKILNNKYYESMAKIESAVYFSCGGHFYHGIADIIFGISNSEVYFHKNLCRIFVESESPEFKAYKTYFDSAKIFMTGIKRCFPVSIIDIKKMPVKYLLIIKLDNFKLKGMAKNVNGEKIIDIEKFRAKLEININESTIYLPDNEDPFMLPLYENFKFLKKQENQYAYLFELSDGILLPQDELRIELGKMWKESDIKF